MHASRRECTLNTAMFRSPRRYSGGPAFCSQPEIASVLAVCNGSAVGPYPLPPGAASGGGGGGSDGSCASPFLTGNGSSALALDDAHDKP